MFCTGEKNIGGKGRKGSFQVKQHPMGFIGSSLLAILAALTTFSSELSLVFKTIPRSSVVVTVGMVWVLVALWDGRV